MTDHFALLNEARQPWLDAEALKEKFHALSSSVHPDRVHGADEAVRNAAGQRYVALNAAYQCLREPKTRLQHLLLLERGTKPGDLKSIPEDVVQLFGDVGASLRQADALLAEMSQTGSPLVKVGLLGKALPEMEKIARLQSNIQASRESLTTELQRLNQDWDESLGTPARRETALGAAERLYHLLGFLDRWSAQLQERLVRLTL